MDIKIFDEEFSVCKLKDLSSVDLNCEFIFIGKTDEEISLVGYTKDIPKNTTAREDNFRLMRMQGVFDFSIVGILSEISSVLASNHISIFAVSTYNTDYILVKSKNIEKAIECLKKSGYGIVINK